MSRKFLAFIIAALLMNGRAFASDDQLVVNVDSPIYYKIDMAILYDGGIGSFDIAFQNPNLKVEYVQQTSWGDLGSPGDVGPFDVNQFHGYVLSLRNRNEGEPLPLGQILRIDANAVAVIQRHYDWQGVEMTVDISHDVLEYHKETAPPEVFSGNTIALVAVRGGKILGVAQVVNPGYNESPLRPDYREMVDYQSKRLEDSPFFLGGRLVIKIEDNVSAAMVYSHLQESLNISRTDWLNPFWSQFGRARVFGDLYYLMNPISVDYELPTETSGFIILGHPDGTYEGLTFDTYSKVETPPTAVEATSWGQVKAQFEK